MPYEFAHFLRVVVDKINNPSAEWMLIQLHRKAAVKKEAPPTPKDEKTRTPLLDPRRSPPELMLGTRFPEAGNARVAPQKAN